MFSILVVIDFATFFKNKFKFKNSMKKTILIILAISVYSTILAFAVDTFNRYSFINNGQSYITNIRSANGYKCIINYTDKDTPKDPQIPFKSSFMTGFEKEVSKSCPDKPKTLEITKQEALQIVQNRLNQKDLLPFILTPENNNF
jgi:hypothetical protein